jgi:hypothetical protein
MLASPMVTYTALAWVPYLARVIAALATLVCLADGGSISGGEQAPRISVDALIDSALDAALQARAVYFGCRPRILSSPGMLADVQLMSR